MYRYTTYVAAAQVQSAFPIGSVEIIKYIISRRIHLSSLPRDGGTWCLVNRALQERYHPTRRPKTFVNISRPVAGPVDRRRLRSLCPQTLHGTHVFAPAFVPLRLRDDNVANTDHDDRRRRLVRNPVNAGEYRDDERRSFYVFYFILFF